MPHKDVQSFPIYYVANCIIMSFINGSTGRVFTRQGAHHQAGKYTRVHACLCVAYTVNKQIFGRRSLHTLW